MFEDNCNRNWFVYTFKQNQTLLNFVSTMQIKLTLREYRPILYVRAISTTFSIIVKKKRQFYTVVVKINYFVWYKKDLFKAIWIVLFRIHRSICYKCKVNYKLDLYLLGVKCNRSILIGFWYRKYVMLKCVNIRDSRGLFKFKIDNGWKKLARSVRYEPRHLINFWCLNK